jgi:competence protein ComEA
MRRFIFLLSLFWLLCGTALAAVNVNSAGKSELESLPGIGPAKASAIIEYRSVNGPFTEVSQLDNVPGIGPATLNNLRSLVVLGDGEAAAPSAQSSTTAPTVSDQDTSGRIDVNTAAQAVLERLPGIGPAKARAIIEYRDVNGGFGSCDDLSRINGIGPATVSSLRDSCTTSQSDSP